MNHQKHLSLPVLQANFRGEPRKVQSEGLEFIAEHGSCTIEGPTGCGKTRIEEALLKGARSLGHKPCYLIAPNKTIVEHLANEIPDANVVLGRHEYDCVCPLYQDEDPLPKSDEIPCLMIDCPCRVSQETGETQEEGAEPCPYYSAKFEAKQGSGMVISTMSFYLFNNVFKPAGETAEGALAIDEAHRLPDVVRNSLSYDITDHHMHQVIDLLKHIEADEFKIIRKFLASLKRIAKSKAKDDAVLLEAPELKRLVAILEEIDQTALKAKIKDAAKRGLVNPKTDKEKMRHLQSLVFDIRKYITSFEYSLPGDERHVEGVKKRGGELNFTCAYYAKELAQGKKVQYRLVVRCYRVAQLIQKISPPLTVSFSATIGDPKVFGYETGIVSPMISLGSIFPVDNTRIYMPKDTPNLAMNERNKRDLAQAVRKVARACKRFAKKGIRCLVVTISNQEREKFLMMAREEGVNTVSYGNGVTAKEAAQEFKDGKGDVLVGTAANYSEGIDLPRQIAPVIFFLRPGYPNPKDPGTIFEERRFGGGRWPIWNWRVMQQALQVRGRNIRLRDDVGVTFFVSQQFRRFLFGALPEWLQKAYQGEMTFEQSLADAEKLLSD